MAAQYWVVKARPETNEYVDLLRKRGHWWWSKTKPNVGRGDRVFLWATSPRLRVEGLAEARESTPNWDRRDKKWRYALDYVTGVLPNPIGIAECRALPALKSASFLKAGPMGTFYPLQREQAVALFAKVVARNPGLSQMWPELRGGQRGSEAWKPPADSIKAPFTRAQYGRALKRIEKHLSEGHRLMLTAHAAAPDRYLDVEALARAAGYPTPQYTYAQYGRLGHMIARALGKGRGAQIWTRVLADDIRDPGTNLVGWTLYPEVAKALVQLGWKRGPATPDPLADVERQLKRLSAFSKTTREQLVQARLGQGEFRQALIAHWRGCAVTGCSILEALKASHIKPWRVSSKAERLNPDNGLLLTANLDALFDAGLITFSDGGMLRISSQLGRAAQVTLGLRPRMRLRRVEEEHRRFLRWHRDHVFRAK